MVYRGHVKNGAVVLDDAARLPEGVAVAVQVVDQTPSEEIHPDIARFSGVLPADLDAKETRHRGVTEKHR